MTTSAPRRLHLSIPHDCIYLRRAYLTPVYAHIAASIGLINMLYKFSVIVNTVV